MQSRTMVITKNIFDNFLQRKKSHFTEFINYPIEEFQFVTQGFLLIFCGPLAEINELICHGEIMYFLPRFILQFFVGLIIFCNIFKYIYILFYSSFLGLFFSFVVLCCDKNIKKEYFEFFIFGMCKIFFSMIIGCYTQFCIEFNLSKSENSRVLDLFLQKSEISEEVNFIV